MNTSLQHAKRSDITAGLLVSPGGMEAFPIFRDASPYDYQLSSGLVCSLFCFTLKPYSRRKFVSSAKQFLPPRSIAPKERRKLASHKVAGTRPEIIAS